MEQGYRADDTPTKHCAGKTCAHLAVRVSLATENVRHIPAKSEVANHQAINDEVNHVFSLILLDCLPLLHFFHAASVNKRGSHATQRRVHLIEIRLLSWLHIFLIDLSVSIRLTVALIYQILRLIRVYLCHIKLTLYLIK